MPRHLLALALTILGASSAGAQPAAPCDTAAVAATAAAPSGDPRAWNSAQALALVARAGCRRRTQLADTSLHDYQATARGYLTFLGQLGDIEIPRVIQATQVATQVYWKAPNISKQIVVGERDTTLLPTDNAFYRDRYGVVQNNFPDVIRVGEGRDVADVPHPLSALGLAAYDFAVRDSLRIRVGGGTLGVIELQVRPKDPSQPRLVGSLFIDRDDAQVVRMAFTFTRSAYLDKRNDAVSIVLENALVQGRYWLPRHQEVEVRRSGTWLDFPAHGIVRGRWEIGDYAVNVNVPPRTFAGAPLEFRPPLARRQYPFAGRVLDSLPADVRTVSDEDVRRVQAQAQALVQREVLARARGSALSARAISDFVRVNRVEGLAVGAGYTLRPGSGNGITARGRYGFDDEQPKGRLVLQHAWPSGVALRLGGSRDFREAGDEPEGSALRNSLAAQEFGSDYTDPYDAAGVALGLDLPETWLGLRPTIELAGEWQDSLAVHARPFNGRYERTIPARRTETLRLTLGAERPNAAGPFGTEWRGSAQLRLATWADRGESFTCGASDGTCGSLARAAFALHVERPFGRERIVTHTTFGVVGGHRTAPMIVGGCADIRILCSGEAADADVPPQDLVYLGGPVTGPGYAFHEFAGGVAASQRVEWRSPVPFPSLSLGTYGRAPASATLAPYVHTVYVARPASFQPRRVGWYPSLGIGAYAFFDLVRFDVARGLRDKRWTFSVDVARDFWRIL
ncbi:hypothetical protein J421_3866 [Gemmatirosa kalamazoonensis]|uniref:Uncharacterized protein n=1 Tax=Gemmatirosa kalamazoonensis TaxID=861299 RepID=W0RPI7_9BACT|nr:hypothetical protein [Gemmatirosa kalamazoonensis]AHG91403.1 hypothetical protein J421_3866 [Gemmatirosa kalamazoonensis]